MIPPVPRVYSGSQYRASKIHGSHNKENTKYDSNGDGIIILFINRHTVKVGNNEDKQRVHHLHVVTEFSQ